jgi:DNA-binding MarR family transcriptional regulator
MLVKSSTVTGVVDRLVQKGLVQRVRNSPDRRVITIELTKTGDQLAENAPPPIQQKIIDGLKKLSESEIDEIAFILSRLTDMLDVQDLEVT